jgi:hypothetical protein
MALRLHTPVQRHCGASVGSLEQMQMRGIEFSSGSALQGQSYSRVRGDALFGSAKFEKFRNPQIKNRPGERLSPGQLGVLGSVPLPTSIFLKQPARDAACAS